MKRIVLFLLLAALQTAFGQNLKQLENRLNRLDSQRRLLVSQIDSLDKRIQQSRHVTDSLRAIGQNSGRLRHQVAGAFSQSLKKIALQKQLKSLEAERSTLHQTIYRQISQRMDSVKKALRQVPPADEQKRLRLELYELGLRLAETSPELRTLNYSPAKIKAIDLAAARDSLERAIMDNYLQGALREVEERLQVLDKKKNEIEEMATLQSKAEDFLDDIDEGPVIAPQTRDNSYTGPTEAGSYGGIDAGRKGTEEQQTFGYWLTQLQQQVMSESPAGQSTDAAVDSSGGYQKTLKKIDSTERALRSLKEMIRQKLEQR